MQNETGYEDKLAYITSHMVRMQHAYQVLLLEQVPYEWPMTKQVDFLYERITKGRALPNTELRPNKPQPDAENALCPKEQAKKSHWCKSGRVLR